MRNARCCSSLIAVFAAIMFLAIETIALAHEIEHDLEQHDEPSCGLHLYVGHIGDAPIATVNVNIVPLPDSFLLSPDVAAPAAIPRLAYRGRAPPALLC